MEKKSRHGSSAEATVMSMLYSAGKNSEIKGSL